MRKAHPDTVEALNAALSAFQSLRALARSWGVDGRVAAVSAAISRARRGRPISARAENELRFYLGLEPLPFPVAAYPCPTCAAAGHYVVHGDGLDCHGQEVAAVVVLQPGQRVTRVRRERSPEVARMVAGLVEAAARAGRLDEDGRVVLPGCRRRMK